MKTVSASLRVCGVILFLALSYYAQDRERKIVPIIKPAYFLGFTPGDDRKLASWAQVVDYFKKLDAASDRMVFEEIGKTTLGAPFVYATISSPENLKDLAKYRDTNDKLADPRKLGTPASLPARDAAAKKLVAEGKTIVLITFGIHSTEVGSTLSSMLIAHELVNSNDPRIKNILDNTIILLVPSLNPDGVDIVKNWYDKTLGTPYEGTEPPELYHKYVGHDNNRDWYAFTQVETQLTVDKIHNVWHPQIVLDVHQQGPNGARQFLPPYLAPVEPNVPKQIVEGFTELGNYMAGDLRKKGLQGITTNTTYDAWTPARAYSHYHGGVRILSETASAKLATPITVKFEDLRGASGGLDAKVESPNFGPVWKGGDWKLRNITDYMTATAFSLLDHAADNREKWLSRFYEIGKEAVRPRKDGELNAYILPPTKTPEAQRSRVVALSMLSMAGVEFILADPKNIKSSTFSTYLGLVLPTARRMDFNEMAIIVRMDQPYANFAKALLENQSYPNLLDPEGNPIQPYDVTAHSLPLLLGIDVIPINDSVRNLSALPKGRKIEFQRLNMNTEGVSIFRSDNPSMDEGWTRWIFEMPNIWERPQGIASMRRNEILSLQHGDRNRTIIFPDQSANQILNGYAKGSMPDEYTGGVGKEGVENLKKFVEAGGTLVFLNRASIFAIEQFNLPVRDVTRGLARKDFYIPGSILRTELDLSHPIAKGMPQQSIAWFEQSPAFEIERQETGDKRLETGATAQSPISGLQSPVSAVKVIARYPSDPKNILLSGWALGAEKIAGKAALVEFTIGKGKIILFGFRPQYRGQSLATFPLLFNAIGN